MSSDPFACLNRIVANAFGVPITYYPSSGALSVNQPYTLRAIPDNPHDLAETSVNDVQKVFWLDGNDTTMPVTPMRGDRVVLTDGSMFYVHEVSIDAENGIVLLCRRGN